MKIPIVPMLLTLALCLIQDAASGNANQETCSEFQALMKNGKLFCSQDKTFLQTPDGVMFIKKCASCKMILEQEAKSQKKARHLARAAQNTAPPQLNCEDFKKVGNTEEFICTTDTSAVCGTDGKTYRSRCDLCAENAKSRKQVSIKNEGHCDSTNPEQDMCSDFLAFVKDGRLECTKESDPHFGPEGEAHGNRCSMCAELFLKEAEEKDKQQEGNRTRRDAEKELCKEFENQVKSGRLFCTRKRAPIYGPDGRIHYNKCSLCAEIFMKRFLEEKSKTTQNRRNARNKAKDEKQTEVRKLCSEYRKHMKNGILICSREIDPIHGLDGKLHINMCSMCQAFFQKQAEEKKAEVQARNKRFQKSLSYEEICREYRPYMKNGKLPCTRENDPIYGPDGKYPRNVCYMCAAFFQQEEKARKRAKRAATKEDCNEFRDKMRNGMLMCTRENDPVIGLDGKRHANKCVMCENMFKLEEEEKNNHRKENEKATMDKVKREAIQKLCNEYRSYLRDGWLPCTKENDPIRGLDGKIHGNTCSMCEAFFLQEAKEKEAAYRAKVKRETEKGTCNEFRSLLQDGNIFCTRENDPVFGPDGKKHGNKCAMCKAIFKKESEDRKKKEEESQRITSGHGSGSGKGKDQDICAEFRGNMKNGELSCTRESDPVRGADGKSYNNKCSMCKELLQKEAEEKNKNSGSRSDENGSTGRKDVCDEFRSQMKNGKLLCTRESDPVKDPNGKIHGNKCAMCKERLEKEVAEKKMKDDEVKRNTGENKNEKEDLCQEFRNMQKDGKFICTRENDPIRGPDGKIHTSKCVMCQTIFEQEANERKRNEEKSSSKSSNNEQCREGPNKAEAKDAKFRQSGHALASVARISAVSAVSAPKSSF
uniref:serine protease inhibitor Kazal-type 5 n=1 Tax=Jaculus jaculus TaxID=51337 RepID=UPI001E1B06AE|nr:serine protease inhibitor Kazal-type 5 [Jaculus jaculus]